MFSSNTTQVSDGGYQISRSLRFNSADSAYLNRTPASAGNRRTFTVSTWVKRAALGTSQYLWEGGSPDGQTTRLLCRFNTDDTLRVATGSTIVFNTTQVFRDPSAWYHIVVAIDTPNGTQASRARLYVNGSEVTTFSSASYFGQNDDTGWNMAQAHSIGRSHVDSAGYLSAYLTDFYNVDGTQLTPSSFGETNAQTGVWQPKAYSGSYGTNGFYLNFSDNSNTTAATLGKDYSGNGNNWTPNNFSVTAGAGNDSLVDSPTSYGTDTGVGGTVRGNYCTWNPLTQSSGTASNGNLQYYGPNSWKAIASTFLLPSTGKWFAEVVLLNAPLSGNFSDMWNGFGVIAPSAQSAWSYNSGTSFFISDTGHYSNYSTGSTGNFAGNTTGTVLGLAFDRDTNQITVYQNGVSKATVTVGVTSGSDLYFFNGSYSATYGSMAVNFGQRPFAYTAPSGFKALCTQNLPVPSIGATTATQAGKYFNTVTYTGNGTGQSITGVGFQPDWVWVKGRSGATDHALYDAVRGVQKQLETNNTDAETTEITGLTAFGSDGFTTGVLAQLNTITATYVAWNWKANGTGSTNTAGSITSTVSANTTSGFSVVTYTGNSTSGATVGHGLGVAPSMVIVKGRDTNGLAWCVYVSSLGASQYLFLNGTDAAGAYAGFWNNTAPTSTLFTLGNDNGTNGTSKTYVAYCFAEVAGYSKFGSYTGNGSADGPFVYTGFRPAYVMVKPSSAAGSWWINDNKRDTYNVNDHRINANTSDAEATAGFTQQDFLSNGFKWRNSDSAWNGSGVTYIYMAFAENPFKYSLAR